MISYAFRSHHVVALSGDALALALTIQHDVHLILKIESKEIKLNMQLYVLQLMCALSCNNGKIPDLPNMLLLICERK